MLITLEMVRKDWHFRPDYSAGRLAKLFDRPLSPIEVLTRHDGEWCSVSDLFRLWVVLSDGILTDKQFRLIADVCAKRAIQTIIASGATIRGRAIDTVATAKKFADSLAEQDPVIAAWAAAYSVAYALVDAAHPHVSLELVGAAWAALVDDVIAILKQGNP